MVKTEWDLEDLRFMDVFATVRFERPVGSELSFLKPNVLKRQRQKRALTEIE
jgi:hypothetical protein